MNRIHSLVQRLHNQDVASLCIRIAVGVAFMHAGYLKLTNLDMVIGGFASMGIPAFLAYFVSYAELICGILVFAGVLVRYAAIILAIIMAVATFLAHWPNGFGLQNGGYEYTFVLFFASAAIVTLGAGKYSLDRLICSKSAVTSQQTPA